MSVISEIRLTVSRTINLGNYESTKIEATVIVGRNDDADTPEKMREEALVEIEALLAGAHKDHVPKRCQGREREDR